jgi:hypothetical protein
MKCDCEWNGFVWEECFRCTCQRVMEENRRKRITRLLVAMWISNLILWLYTVGEIYRWWG